MKRKFLFAGFSLLLGLLPSVSQAQLRVTRRGQVEINSHGGEEKKVLTVNSNVKNIYRPKSLLFLDKGGRGGIYFGMPGEEKIAPVSYIKSTIAKWDKSNKNSDFFISLASGGILLPKFSIETSFKNDEFHHSFRFRTGYSGQTNCSTDSNPIERRERISGDEIFEELYMDEPLGLIIDDSAFGQTTLRPVGSGYGSIGTSSNYWSDLYSNRIYAREHPYITSDERSKTNIERISDENILSQLDLLKPVRYNLKQEGNKDLSQADSKMSANMLDSDFAQVKAIHDRREAEYCSRKQYGFVAQELAQVFPDIVSLDEETGMYSVQYTALIPVLVEAVQQLKSENEALRKKVDLVDGFISGRLRGAEWDNKTFVGEREGSKSSIVAPHLFSNKPNPFSSKTIVDYWVPSGVESAYVAVTDLSGRLLKSYPCTDFDCRASVEISSEGLADGIYLYSLVVDNEEISTFKMVVKR